MIAYIDVLMVFTMINAISDPVFALVADPEPTQHDIDNANHSYSPRSPPYSHHYWRSVCFDYDLPIKSGLLLFIYQYRHRKW